MTIVVKVITVVRLFGAIQRTSQITLATIMVVPMFESRGRGGGGGGNGPGRGTHISLKWVRNPSATIMPESVYDQRHASVYIRRNSDLIAYKVNAIA